MAKMCFIMRGVPGSGKSTAARTVAVTDIPGKTGEFWLHSVGYGADQFRVTYYGVKDEELIASAIHSTDDYFLNDDGIYEFNRQRLGMHHTKNFKAFRKSCETEVPIVICDNTNLVRKEWKKYASCADNRGYIVSFVEMPLPKAGVAAERNSHGVPLDDIKRMIRKWEPFNGKF